MTMRLETNLNFVTFGGSLLEGLLNYDWALPLQGSSEELGFAMGSHIGLIRSRNEDRLAVARVQALNSETYTVALVCDGVGGSADGDRAATFAIFAVLIELCSLRTRPPIADLATFLVKSADEFVRRELGGRGTTTLSMYLASASGPSVCASVGDSRVYSWSRESQVVQVTTDDTVENELKALPGDHEALLKARGLKGRLSQAVGETGRSSDELRVQLFSRDFFGVGVFLGSDGLWKSAKDFENVMLYSRSALEGVRRAINLANWVGGLDNVSIIAIEDVQRFCSVGRPSALGPRQTSLSLWIGPSSFTFVGESRPRWTVQENQEKHDKPVKTKRKPSKSKRSDPKLDAPQLALSEEKNSSIEPKPIIEVVLGSGGLKGAS